MEYYTVRKLKSFSARVGSFPVPSAFTLPVDYCQTSHQCHAPVTAPPRETEQQSYTPAPRWGTLSQARSRLSAAPQPPRAWILRLFDELQFHFPVPTLGGNMVPHQTLNVKLKKVTLAFASNVQAQRDKTQTRTSTLGFTNSIR